MWSFVSTPMCLNNLGKEYSFAKESYPDILEYHVHQCLIPHLLFCFVLLAQRIKLKMCVPGRH